MGTGQRNRGRQGMALPLALVTVLIISALLGGIMLLSVSHLALSGTNSDYANALGLAEAGVNWELWKIGLDETQADQADVTVPFPAGSGRSFTVRTEAYPDAPGDLWVIATGAVNGARRTVRVRARGGGPTGNYALFGIDTLNTGGSLHVIGATGTNGIVDENGNPTFDGNFWYCGTASGDEVTYPGGSPYQAYHSDVPEYFPTVNDLANQRAKERWGVTTDLGVDFFDTSGAGGTPYNDNASIRDASGAVVTFRAGQIDWRDVANAGTTLWDGTPLPEVYWEKPVVVLRPGDYYFTGLDTTGNKFFFIDDREGAVNIWLGPSGGSGQPDTLTGNSMFFAGDEANNFHLYEGSRRTLVMEGTVDFHGHVYAYNGPSPSGDYWGSIILRGDADIVGSIVGYDVRHVTGNATITFPSGGGGEDPGGFGRYHAVAGSWEELNQL